MGYETAAVLIVGDEILSGRTRDANAHLAARKLFDRGCRLVEVAIVPDQRKVIVQAIRRLREVADAVITSGGIGPTHDDVTMEAVAEALQRPLVEHAPTLARLRERFGARIGLRRRMARLPEGAEPIVCERTFLPGAAVDDVYVLAGVPEIFASQLETILPRFGQDQGFLRVEIEVRLPESSYAEGLEAVQAQFPAVHIGSYPKRCGADPHAVICLEARSEKMLRKAEDAVRAMLRKLESFS